jgi:hypothetical protein
MQINKKFIKSLLNYDMSDLIDEINDSFYTHSKILFDEKFGTEQELFSFVKFLAYVINFSKKTDSEITKALKKYNEESVVEELPRYLINMDSFYELGIEYLEEMNYLEA